MKKWERFNHFMSMIWYYMLLNFYWIIFVMMGLGFFGIFPATITFLHLSREHQYKHKGFENIFRRFFRYFRQNFIKINFMGIIFYMIIYIIYLAVATILENQLFYLIPWVILLSHFIFSTIVYILNVYVSFEMKIWEYFYQGLIICFLSPISAISITIVTVLWLIVIDFFPVLIPFFSVNLIFVSWYILCQKSFQKIINKQKHNN